ncbi:MAG: hypothetical protein WC615_08895 [Mucilaginibacter sp.]|jgi:hypothetical protein|uniref:hypothetical protein n=1 Tax=Mucilaginibacter sp. TaxID=1882438 RepID=UPI00356133C7
MRKAKNITGSLLLILLFGYFIFRVALNYFTDSFLGDKPQIVKAVIVNEKNYMPNQRIDPDFSYSYSFIAKGKEYKGNSHDASLKVSDTIEVKYNKDFPWINKPSYLKY